MSTSFINTLVLPLGKRALGATSARSSWLWSSCEKTNNTGSPVALRSVADTGTIW